MTKMRKIFTAAVAGYFFMAGAFAQTAISLLDGRLTFVLPENFEKTEGGGAALGSYGATDGEEWLQVSLAGKPLPEGGLEAWMDRKKAAYTKGMSPEIRPHMRWLDHKILKRGGVEWADLRFDCVPDGPDGGKRAILYTRFLATTLDGRLLEFVFSSNLTPDAKRKAALDRIADSVKFKP